MRLIASKLYNGGNELVLLYDYILMDDNINRERAPAPGKLIVVQGVDDEPDDGLSHVPFKRSTQKRRRHFKINIMEGRLK